MAGELDRTVPPPPPKGLKSGMGIGEAFEMPSPLNIGLCVCFPLQLFNVPPPPAVRGWLGVGLGGGGEEAKIRAGATSRAGSK